MKQAIIIVGGYNSLWPAYLKLARELEDLAGLQAVAVPLMPWHWWSAARDEDASNILRRLEQTVAWARRKHQVERFIVVGHSAGGLVARIYLCDRPASARVYAGAEHVTGLVTLGSPHCSDQGEKASWFLASEANRLAAGAAYGDRVRYYTVAGRCTRGDRNGTWAERRSHRNYEFFDGRGDVWGDGAVPVECAHLAGARGIVLEGVSHSRKYGSNWYGSSASVVHRWWPDWASCDH
jgi:pimeloyl-ACP methyl ester carboxylesterase